MDQNSGRHLWHARKLELFQTKCLRRFLNIYWPNVISNEDWDVYNIGDHPWETRWRWLGHVFRMPHPQLNALCWTPQRKRKTGRAKEAWRRTVLKIRGLPMETAPRVAADRARWRSLQPPDGAEWSESVSEWYKDWSHKHKLKIFLSLFVLICFVLFVCLFVCLFACLFVCFLPRRTSVRFVFYHLRNY